MHLTPSVHPAIALFLASALAAPAAAQDAPRTPEPPAITVTGEATITVIADRAQIDLAVVTQAKSAREAATRNKERSEKLSAELRQRLPAGTTLETVSYHVSPQYAESKDGSAPVLSGYSAMNAVRVTTDDVAQVGSIVDAAIQAGADHVQNLGFTLRDEQQVRRRALREAAARARLKGDDLAAALGVRVVRIYQVREDSPPSMRPYSALSVAYKDAESATPIEPGRIEVEGRVTLVLQISD